MSIKDLLEKVKPFYTLILILVITSIAFALGRISIIEERHTPIKIEYQNTGQTSSVIQTLSPRQSLGLSRASTTTDQTGQSGTVIGSKNGTKYYFPWCGSVKNIKLENQVKFVSASAARAAGYTPAANCKGLR